MLLLQLTHLAIWGSIVTWFVFLAAYAHVWPTVDLAPEMVGMVSKLPTTLTSVTCLLTLLTSSIVMQHMNVTVIYLYITRNTFCGMRYLSHCDAIYSLADVWPALVGLQLLPWSTGGCKAGIQLVQRRCLQLLCKRSAM